MKIEFWMIGIAIVLTTAAVIITIKSPQPGAGKNVNTWKQFIRCGK